MTPEPSDTGTQPPALEPVDPALVPQRSLAGGARIPVLGLGTFGSDRFSGEQVAEAVRDASVGYRHFDCASVYGNEAQIGRLAPRDPGGRGQARGPVGDLEALE